MNREPPRVKALRKKAALAPESDLGVVMAYADRLREELEAAGQLELSDEQILAAAGPPMDEVGGKGAWVLGRKDLLAIAHAILHAAGRQGDGQG